MIEHLTKTEIEGRYPGITIEESDINTYLIVFHKAGQPARFSEFKQLHSKDELMKFLSKRKEGDPRLPVIKIIKEV